MKKYKISYSPELVDITTKLLCKDKNARLGANEDAKEIMSHPWFNDLDINSLLSKKMTPPYVPKKNEFTNKCQRF